MDFWNEKNAVQLTKGSSGITKLHFSKCSDLSAIFIFFIGKEEKVKRANVPCRVFLVTVKHTHIQRIYLMLLLFRSISNIWSICFGDSQHATRNFARVRSAEGHPINICIHRISRRCEREDIQL